MARKPSTYQPLLPFPDPDDTPLPDGNVFQGGSHAIQDDSARTPPAASAAAQPALPEPDAAAHDGMLGRRAEDAPRTLEGPAVPGETGQRPEPDRERSAGTGTQGTGGLFTLRVAGRGQPALARRSDAVRPPSNAAPVQPSRQRRLLAPLARDAAAVAELESAGAEEPRPPAAIPTEEHPAPSPLIAAGEKAKARDILAAIRGLKRIEQEQRPATP